MAKIQFTKRCGVRVGQSSYRLYTLTGWCILLLSGWASCWAAPGVELRSMLVWRSLLVWRYLLTIRPFTVTRR